MGLFDSIKTNDDIQEEKDIIGGQTLNTGIYDFTIEYAYVDFSKSEAMNVNLMLKTQDGKSLRLTEYVTSGKEKGKLNYYTTKNGDKRYLPGFEKVNHICLLSVGKELGELDTDPKVLKLYNPDLKKEAPMEKQVITDLTGQEITIGLVNVLEDKYSNPTESRTVYEINKVFRTKDSMTVAEIKAQEPEATFIDKWKSKFTSEYVKDIRDKSKGEASQGDSSSNQGASKPKQSLFS